MNGFSELSGKGLSRLEVEWVELYLDNFIPGQSPKVRLLKYHCLCFDGSFLLALENPLKRLIQH